ncbi:MAG TPA: hypothetical protein VMG59_09290 [Phycisphaerae bacterium]|nr:hypothetical protein [Phycisphaerae bacterium]
MNREQILKELDAYIDVISKPLPAHDLANGWDAERQHKAIRIMNEIREVLRTGGALPKWSIVRTMDSWGVKGELFDQACAISHHLKIMKD